MITKEEEKRATMFEVKILIRNIRNPNFKANIQIFFTVSYQKNKIERKRIKIVTLKICN